MVSISRIVQRYIEGKPMLQEGLARGIINYAGLAEEMLDFVEEQFGKKVKISAVVMALRRYSETVRKKIVKEIPFDFESEIIMKTNICDLTIVKTNSAIMKLEKLYRFVDFEKGDTLNVIQGNYEVTIVLSQKYLKKINELLKGEKILNIEKDLVSLTLQYPKKFLYTPGILSTATRKLAWENINIFENISTMTEIIFIVSKKDAMRSYYALQELGKN